MPEVQLRGGEVDGLVLNYVVEGHGRPVVLVHGLAGFAASWRHTIPALADRARVYALDLPGFGLSAKPLRAYELAFFAHAVHGFLDAIGVSRASLVGHSLGGAVCVAYALSRPARVERLALLGAIVPGFGYQMPWVARVAAVHGIGELLGLCGSAPLYKAAIARCFRRPMRDEIDFLVDCDYPARAGAAARAAYLATVRGMRQDFDERAEGFRRAIATIDAPVLLIHGRQDRVVDPSHCAAVATGLGRATVRWLDECGHFPHIEHVDAVNGWLAEFLVGRPAPR
jgi:pimeloyl-ACP methyl ester carboxylesterase